MKRGATATPFASVRIVTERRRCANVPDAPCAGAVKRTGAPATALPSLSVTVTASGTGNAVPAGADSVAAAPAAILSGLPARLRSEKTASDAVPVAVAVAVKDPETEPAVRRGDTAIPREFVIVVA